MKKIYLMAAVFAVNFAQAQLNSKEVIVANGGLFEFTPPSSDYATIGAYNLTTQDYTTFDTIKVESVSDVEIPLGSEVAFVGASDSIIRYDLFSHQRTHAVQFNSVKSISKSGDYIIAGKNFGTGDYLTVYNEANLTVEFSITDADIAQTVYGGEVIGDSLYVVYNQKGVVDQYPPYLVFKDTLGKIGVIDMVNQSFVREINLDTAATDIRAIRQINNKLYIVCNNGNLIEYDPSTAQTSNTVIDNMGITVLTFENTETGAELTYKSGLGVELFNYKVESSTVSGPFSIVANSTIAAGTHDFLNDVYFTTTTDYSSYGELFIYDGSSIDSLPVQISPEAIAISYINPSSISELITDEVRIYPNPASNLVTVRTNSRNGSIQVFDISGKQLSNENYTSDNFQLNISNYSAGTYYIVITSSSLRQTTKLIKL